MSNLTLASSCPKNSYTNIWSSINVLVMIKSSRPDCLKWRSTRERPLARSTSASTRPESTTRRACVNFATTFYAEGRNTYELTKTNDCLSKSISVRPALCKLKFLNYNQSETTRNNTDQRQWALTVFSNRWWAIQLCSDFIPIPVILLVIICFVIDSDYN